MAFGAKKPQTKINPRDFATCTRIMAHVFNQRDFELQGLYNGLTPVNTVKDSTHWLGIASKHGQTVVLFGGDKYNIAKGQIPHYINPDGYSYHIETTVNTQRVILDCQETGFTPQLETILHDPELTVREKESQLCDVAANAAQDITALMRNNLKPLRSFRAKVLPDKGRGGRLLVTVPDGTALSGYAKYILKETLQTSYQSANVKNRTLKGWVVRNDAYDVEGVREFLAQTSGLPSEIQVEEPVTETLGFLDAPAPVSVAAPAHSANTNGSLQPATPQASNGTRQQVAPQASNGTRQQVAPQASNGTRPPATEQAAYVPATNALIIDRDNIDSFTNDDGVAVG